MVKLIGRIVEYDAWSRSDLVTMRKENAYPGVGFGLIWGRNSRHCPGSISSSLSVKIASIIIRIITSPQLLASLSPRWPEAPGQPYKQPPAYQAYPPFLEPTWRYEFWQPQK